MSDAPASMPSEEMVARAIRDEYGIPPSCDYPACIGGECGHDCERNDRSVEAFSGAARAILALFAPILAEKERETRQLKLEVSEERETSRISIYVWRDKANEMEAALTAAHDAYQQAAVDTLALLHEAEARALAAEAEKDRLRIGCEKLSVRLHLAEAALAGERERTAKLLDASKRASEILRGRGYPGWGVAKDILNEAIAAAIRAGE